MTDFYRLEHRKQWLIAARKGHRFVSGPVAAADVQTGSFGADMKVELLNDGPVTIVIDSKTRE